MRKFLKTFTGTITDTSTYRQIARAPLKDSIVYSLTSYLIYLAIASLYLSIVIAPSLFQIMTSLLNTVAVEYPKSAQISINTSGLSLQNADRIIITNPEANETGFNNFIAVNPSASLSELESADALIMANNQALFFSTTFGEPLELPFVNFPEAITLSATDIETYITKVLSELEVLYRYRFFVIAVSLTLVTLISRSLYLVLYTVINRGFGWLTGRKYSYTMYLKLSLHTIILAEILYGLHFLLFPGKFNIFPMAFIGLNLIAMLSLPKVETHLTTRNA